jgi:hypothetical protein
MLGRAALAPARGLAIRRSVGITPRQRTNIVAYAGPHANDDLDDNDFEDYEMVDSGMDVEVVASQQVDDTPTRRTQQFTSQRAAPPPPPQADDQNSMITAGISLAVLVVGAFVWSKRKSGDSAAQGEDGVGPVRFGATDAILQADRIYA